MTVSPSAPPDGAADSPDASAASRRWKRIRVAGLVVVAALIGLGMWQLFQPHRQAQTAEIKGVMGTDAEILAVVMSSDPGRGDAAIRSAKAVLAEIDARMSAYREDSEVGRINAAAVGKEVALSPSTLEVLALAKECSRKTGGAFDVTCGAIIVLWRDAAKQQLLPTPEQLKQAVQNTGWEGVSKHPAFRLTARGVVKLQPAARIDLGGIAKKYAIDRAVAAMQAAGVQGGLVNVGGDLRCFGTSVQGEPWPVAVRYPFDADQPPLANIELKEGAVCTSGNYERFVEIRGQRYSHIKDPRTGESVDLFPSVTVVGPTAMESGVWATALSVLGPRALTTMQKDGNLDAMVIVGNSRAYTSFRTKGMDEKYLVYGPRSPASMPAGVNGATRSDGNAEIPAENVTAATAETHATTSAPADNDGK